MLVLFALTVRKILVFLFSVKQKSKNKLAEIQSQLQGKVGLLCLKN